MTGREIVVWRPQPGSHEAETLARIEAAFRHISERMKGDGE